MPLESQPCILAKLIKTKDAVHPWFSGGGSLFWTPNPDLEGPGPWKDLGPMSIWSHGHSLWRGSKRPKKGAWCGSGASAVHFGKNSLKQKWLGTPNYCSRRDGVGGRSPFLDPKSGSGRTWVWCASGALVSHFQGEFITWKL